MSKLNLAGLRLFKKKNDETYLKQNDAININDLAEEDFVEDDDIFIKGQGETGDLVKVKASTLISGIASSIAQTTGISPLKSTSTTGSSGTEFAYTADSANTHTITCSEYPAVIFVSYSSTTSMIYWNPDSSYNTLDSNLDISIDGDTMTINCTEAFVLTVISASLAIIA